MSELPTHGDEPQANHELSLAGTKEEPDKPTAQADHAAPDVALLNRLFVTQPEESTGFWSIISRWSNSPRRQLKKRLQTAIGRALEEPEDVLESIVAESDLHAFDNRRGSRWWGRAYYLLGLPAAVLAAIAGATGLISTAGRVPAAIIALVAAGLSAAATFLNSEQNRKKDDELSAGWQSLADDARVSLLTYRQAAKTGSNEGISGLGSQQAPKLIDSIVHLHRRKSRLLRGDLRTDDLQDTQQLPNSVAKD